MDPPKPKKRPSSFDLENIFLKPKPHCFKTQKDCACHRAQLQPTDRPIKHLFLRTRHRMEVLCNSLMTQNSSFVGFKMFYIGPPCSGIADRSIRPRCHKTKNHKGARILWLLTSSFSSSSFPCCLSCSWGIGRAHGLLVPRFPPRHLLRSRPHRSDCCHRTPWLDE